MTSELIDLMTNIGNEFEYANEELKSDDNDDDDDDAHSKLISNISSLESNKKTNKWKLSRKESSKDANEFNFNSINNSRAQRVNISDLIKSVKDESGLLKKQLRTLQKKKALKTPLEKPVSELIKRKVNYELVSKEVSKWDDIVIANRNAEQLQFPLKSVSLKLKSAKEIVKNFKPKTKLEIEVSKILKNSDNVLSDDKLLTAAEEKYLKAMNLEEAKLRHKELQRMRALLSFQESKLKRKSKIKSKRYHRILKRERLKKEMNDFEDAKINDPEAALNQLNDLERLRALERASLKHKNTGKWAKHHKIIAKYNDDARRAISEQIQLSRKLTKKLVNDDSESDQSDHEIINDEYDLNDNQITDEPNVLINDYNPWMRNGKTLPLITPEKRNSPENIQNETNESSNKIQSSSKWIVSPIKRKDNSLSDKKEEIFSETNNEPLIVESFGNNPHDDAFKIKNFNSETNTVNLSNDAKIDPNDFLTIKSKKNRTSFPNITQINADDIEDNHVNEVNDDEEDDDIDKEQRKIISEAFADDDVVNDFDAEKREVIDNEKEKNISLYLPGWGHWAGNGIRENKRKIAKYTIKGEKKIRKDNNIGNVIISEKKDEVIAKYKVNDLPFPFKNVIQFENSIRHPIGNTWNTETAFRNLIEPKVVTKMGTIIEPIDTDSLVKSKPKRRKFKKRPKNDKKDDNNMDKD